MTGAAKRKGDMAEREVGVLLQEHLGIGRRKLGAGRKDDEGDIEGIPGTVIQVAWWPKKGVLNAVRHKPVDAERQRENAGVPFACSFIRLVGGDYRVVMTPEQFFTIWREAQ